MRASHKIVIAIGTLLGAHLLTVGCGNKGSDSDGPGTGSQPGDGDVGGENGGDCTGVGLECSADSECCTEFCDPSAGICSRGGGACLTEGATCTLGLECCTLACIDGSCSESQCVADGETCDSDEECCGGSCDDGECAPLNQACKTAGNPCESSTDCCSQYCTENGLCGSPSYCGQAGDVCATNEECCGGGCQKADGEELGLCQVVPSSGTGECLTAGEVCSEGATYDGGDLPICGGACCSRACYPYGPTGVLICQPPSGCSPTGEVCETDKDCCGAEGLPDGDTAHITCSKVGDNAFGRCTQGNSCTPAGGICRLQDNECNANANCCSGNVLTEDTCSQDNLGIPRCLAEEIDCTNPQDFVGQSCSTSADCCNLPCVPNPGGDPPYVCGDACIEQGEICSTTADCCSGLSCLGGRCDTLDPPDGTGGSDGTGGGGGACAEYGQACMETADCCNDVPCTGGVCMVVVK